MLEKKSKIYIAGHNGMVGSACWRLFKSKGYKNLIGKSSNELDLRSQSDVENFISNEKPDLIIDAAAKVGGIFANSKFPFEFLMDNLLIQNNLIRSSYNNKVSKFIFLGSSCIYPKMAKQPLKEEYLLSGPLETTNQSYAVAKISGVKLIESLRNQYNLDYISLMPTNLYGPFDNFDPISSHVLPAMIRKFYDAKQNNKDVKLWGTGTPMREFLYVDDLAQAVLFSSLRKMPGSLYNIGTGKDISIEDLALIVQRVVGHDKKIQWDSDKPDGTPRKLLDTSKMSDLGWNHSIELESGIEKTYKWFINNIDQIKEVNF